MKDSSTIEKIRPALFCFALLTVGVVTSVGQDSSPTSGSTGSLLEIPAVSGYEQELAAKIRF